MTGRCTGMVLQPYRRSHCQRTTRKSSTRFPCSTAVGRAFLLLVTAYHCTTIRSVPLAYAAQQPHQPAVLRNEDGGDDIYGNALGDSHSRRNRLHLHRAKQRRSMLSSEEGGEDSSKPKDEVDEQESDQPAVYKGTSASLHRHSVKGPRKKEEEVADKKIDDVREDDVDRQSSAKDDVNEVDGFSKEKEKEMKKEKENMRIEKEPGDQEKKNDKTTPQSFGDVKGEVEQYGGTTKKKTDVLKEKKVLQPHAKSDEEEQNAIARKNGWKEKDKEKKDWNKPYDRDDGKDGSGCVCDKWESSGSKAGKSKGSKTKGSKTKGSKGKGSMGSVYHKKCIKWSCDKDIV